MPVPVHDRRLAKLDGRVGRKDEVWRIFSSGAYHELPRHIPLVSHPCQRYAFFIPGAMQQLYPYPLLEGDSEIPVADTLPPNSIKCRGPPGHTVPPIRKVVHQESSTVESLLAAGIHRDGFTDFQQPDIHGDGG
jgi:hypothetical protein